MSLLKARCDHPEAHTFATSTPGSRVVSTASAVASWRPLRNAQCPLRKCFTSGRPVRLQRACNPKLQHRSPLTTASAASSSSGSTESSSLVTFYTGLAAVFAASAAARLANPQWYAELAHDACPNGLAAGLIRLSGATLIPIAAALWTLKGAAEHDRLASNTYRRLNLGLAAWAASNLTLLAKGAAEHVVTWCTGVQTVVYLVTIAACGYAWSTSTGYAPTGRQIIDGVTDDIRNLFKNSSWLSALLSALSVFAAAAGILTLVEPFQYFQPEAFRALNGGLGGWYMRGYSNNLLFIVVLLTSLKDALDRERHRASTFRLLAQAGLASSLAEIATFYFTGQASGVVREVVIGAIMAAYLTKE
ncbi:g6757 [Coccomyxa viridis]|uniref:G6757 protein n=1 Tax=Coccomyxa viridis TaxID=1274662 RepID=A0ABP1FW49_9CHLO